MTEHDAELVARLLEALWRAYGGKRKFSRLPLDHPAKIITGKALAALLARLKAQKRAARRIVH